MESFVVNTFEDAQTAITSLGGAVAGAAAERIGSELVRAVGLQSQASVGDIGMRFVVRALASSAVYASTVALMPETSKNILFTLFYFGANPSIGRDAVSIGNALVGAIPSPGAVRAVAAQPAQKKSPKPCDY